MRVTSLFALRKALRDYLAVILPEAEILPSLPAARRPVPEGAAALVIGVQSLRRGEALLNPAQDGLLLEVGLTFTICHRDSSEECEQVADVLASLPLRADFPFCILTMQCGAAEFNRTIGAFTLRCECTVACLLSHSEEADD